MSKSQKEINIGNMKNKNLNNNFSFDSEKNFISRLINYINNLYPMENNNI